MKRVDVITSSQLSAGIGPVQTIKRVINNHVYFMENGYDVSVFSAENVGISILAEVKKKDSKVISIIKEVARWFALNTRLYSTFRIYLMFKQPHKILHYYASLNRSADIVIFHSLIDCYIYLKYYKAFNTKVGLFTHSDGKMFEMLLSYFPRLKGTVIEKKLHSIASFIMDNVDVKPCIAKIEERNLLIDFPQLKGKTCLVINGVDDLSPEQISEVEELKSGEYPYKYRVVCSGSINGRKGQSLMVEAFSQLSDELKSNIHITFLGNGPEKITLEEKVDVLGLNKHISFTGLVPNAEVYKYIGASNIFMLISKMEGLPIAIIEALRCGIAVVSTKVSGIPEQIDEGVNGLLINPTVDDVKNVFENLDNYDWAKMGKSSRLKYESEYTFARMKSNYVNMLNKAFGA